MKHIWRKQAIGIDTEATRWTPASAPKFFPPQTSYSFEDVIEKEMDTGATWTIYTNQQAVVVKHYWSWDIEFIPDLYTFIPFLSAITWTNYKDLPAWVDNLDWTYKHTFNVPQNAQHCALTVFKKDENLGNLAYSLWMINTASITINAVWLSTFTTNIISKKWESVSAFTTDYETNRIHFKGANTTLKLWASLASLTDIVKVKTATLNFTKNVEPDYIAWNITPDDINNQSFTIDITAEIQYNDDTYFNYFVNNTERAASLEVNTWATWSLAWKFKSINFSEYSKKMDNDTLITQTITAQLVVNGNTDVFFAELNNTIENLSTI